jgi:hypothetical protein
VARGLLPERLSVPVRSRTSESKRARSNGLRLSPSSTSGARHPAYLTFAGVSWRRERAPARVALQSSRAAPVRSRAGSCALLTVPIPSGYRRLATATSRKRCRSHGCSRRSKIDERESRRAWRCSQAKQEKSDDPRSHLPPGERFALLDPEPQTATNTNRWLPRAYSRRSH